MTGKQKTLLLAAVAMATALVPEIALAQATGQSENKASPADEQNCAAPRDPSRKSDRKPRPEEELSNRLENCNGVLKAPEAGDKDMVTPAPDTGNSRVIQPGDVPDNANPSNGSGQ